MSTRSSRRTLHNRGNSLKLDADIALLSNGRVSQSTNRLSALYNKENIIPAKTSPELVELYQTTIEMSVHGKITIKNAFDYLFLEYLSPIIKNVAQNENGPNFVKAGNVINTSAKIYAYRVDALHTETQKLSMNMSTVEQVHNLTSTITMKNDNGSVKMSDKTKTRSHGKKNEIIVTDISKISINNIDDNNELIRFRPLLPTSLCCLSKSENESDSIHHHMISCTTYSTSDYSFIRDFANIQIKNFIKEELKSKIRFQHAIDTIYSLEKLRDIIEPHQHVDHSLGTNELRNFLWNETTTDSTISTIHETSLDEFSQQNDITTNVYNSGEQHFSNDISSNRLSSFIFMDDVQSMAYEFSNNLDNVLRSSQPSQYKENFVSVFDNAPFPSTTINDQMLSIVSNDINNISRTSSFFGQIPSLLKNTGSKEYNYFDVTKLKLFAGPNLWKYVNLLENYSQLPSQQQQAQARERKHTGSGAVIQQQKCDFFSKQSLSSIFGKSKGRTKQKSLKRTLQSISVLRSRENINNQIKQSRKICQINELFSTSYFLDLFISTAHSSKSVGEKLNIFDVDELNDYDQADDIPLPFGFESDEDIQSRDNLEIIVESPEPERYYEKIEYTKRTQQVNVKKLKYNIIEEFKRLQSNLTAKTTVAMNDNPVEFVQLCECLLLKNSLNLTEIPSAFYCMLFNCNEHKLYLQNTANCDNLLITNQPLLSTRQQ